eukprot:scaffold92541_cov22-Tisochrysis_lutea.AAC.1
MKGGGSDAHSKIENQYIQRCEKEMAGGGKSEELVTLCRPCKAGLSIAGFVCERRCALTSIDQKARSTIACIVESTE